MLTALVLASVAQFSVIVEYPGSVVYETPVVRMMEYRYSYVPEIRSVSTVTYSLPEAYYLRAEPLVPVYSFQRRGRTVIKERGFGFRGRTVIRY